MFLQLPDVSPTITKLNNLPLKEIQRAANEGIDKLNNIEGDIKKSLDDTLDEANTRVESAGKCLSILHNVI